MDKLNLEAIRALIAEGKTARQISEVMGITRQRVLRAADRHKLGPWKSAPGRQVKVQPPAELPQLIAELRLHRLVAERLGVARSTVQKWAADLGIQPVKAPPAPKKKKEGPFVIDMHRAFKPASGVVHKEDTAAGEAQRYLQSQGYVPVFRSDNLGREPKPRGRFWRCGRRVLTDAEIVALAAEVRERRERRMGVA